MAEDKKAKDARILDGRALSRVIRKEIKQEADALREEHGVVPRLDVIRVGEDPASASYVRSKLRLSERLGMRAREHHLAADVSEADLGALVDRLNEDEDVDAILLQLPLPGHLDEESFLGRITPEKDVDGFHPVNAGRLFQGQPTIFAPCTPLGVMEMFRRAGVELKGRDAVMIGRSNIVGRPLAMMMDRANATVTLCHGHSRDLKGKVRAADVVVTATGVPGLIQGDWIKPGAVVIDIGLSRLEDGSLVGDVDFDAALERASLITPAPGGVGPMTVTMVVRQTLRSAKTRRGIE